MIINTDIVINLHKRIIETSGGTHGVRDYKLVGSAVNTIYQTYDSNDLYPTIIEKAARLCYGLSKNHPFIDGNKRT